MFAIENNKFIMCVSLFSCRLGSWLEPVYYVLIKQKVELMHYETTVEWLDWIVTVIINSFNKNEAVISPIKLCFLRSFPLTLCYCSIILSYLIRTLNHCEQRNIKSKKECVFKACRLGFYYINFVLF